MTKNETMHTNTIQLSLSLHRNISIDLHLSIYLLTHLAHGVANSVLADDGNRFGRDPCRRELGGIGATISIHLYQFYISRYINSPYLAHGVADSIFPDDGHRFGRDPCQLELGGVGANISIHPPLFYIYISINSPTSHMA